MGFSRPLPESGTVIGAPQVALQRTFTGLPPHIAALQDKVSLVIGEALPRLDFFQATVAAHTDVVVIEATFTYAG